MKTVLVLGAGRGQVALYKAAKEIGARTVAISIPGDYPGFEHADEIEYVDILDKEGVLKAAEKHGADAVVTACVDFPVPTLGYVCEKLGLKGISYEAAVVSTNKLLMKKAFEEAGVTIVEPSEADKEAFAAAAAEAAVTLGLREGVMDEIKAASN